MKWKSGGRRSLRDQLLISADLMSLPSYERTTVGSLSFGSPPMTWLSLTGSSSLRYRAGEQLGRIQWAYQGVGMEGNGHGVGELIGGPGPWPCPENVG